MARLNATVRLLQGHPWCWVLGFTDRPKPIFLAGFRIYGLGCRVERLEGLFLGLIRVQGFTGLTLNPKS